MVEYYIKAFARVHPTWLKIFKKHESSLDKILRELKECQDEITPSMEYIFHAFCFNVQHTNVVIIGQDPYPTKGDANGMCFSTNATKTPASLKNIFKHLNTLGYSTESNDLSQWARQGVLLLNSALTTIVGRTKSHTSIWLKFVQNIVTDLTESVTDHKIHFLLWGSDAQFFQPFIKGEHIIKKFSHPSPLSTTPFKPMDHFIKSINWSTSDEPVVVYTDGADELHGKSAFGVYIPGILTCTGLVDHNEFELQIDEDTMYVPQIITKEDTEIAATSQRAEYLAMCYALWIVNWIRPKHSIIVTDSYNARGLILEWDEHRKTKNKDLVRIMNNLYDSHQTWCEDSGINGSLEIEHIRSHNKETDPEKKEKYGEGNNLVDKLAVETLKTKKDYGLYIHYYKVDLGL